MAVGNESVASRYLSRTLAAKYLCLSTRMFDKLVASGKSSVGALAGAFS